MKYNNLTPFKWCILQNFPFIEATFDAIDNYQLWCKVVEYLNKTIDKTNIFGNELEKFGNELEKFENYFNTLDVQDEINKKLDEFAEDGTLLNILSNYVNIQKVYNTFQEVLEDENILKNQKIKTLGYYNINDNGGAEYIISNEQNNYEYQEQLNNGLYANLIIKNEINFKQIGGKNDIEDNYSHFDNKLILQKYINFCKYKKVKLYIPSGIYCFSETLLNNGNSGFEIYGDNFFSLNNLQNGTVIAPVNNYQDYIWKIGGNENKTTEPTGSIQELFTIDNIIFTCSQYEVNSSRLLFVDEVFMIDYAVSGYINVKFRNIFGTAISFNSCWEISIPNIIVYGADGINNPKILFKNRWTNIFGVGTNITALNIENILMESFNGIAIQSQKNSNLDNSIINNIIIEDNYYRTSNINAINVSNDYTETQPLFNFEYAKITINNIVIQNLLREMCQIGNNIYIRNRIFETLTETENQVILNNLQLTDVKNKNFVIFSANNKNFRNYFIINNFTMFGENAITSDTLTDINNYEFFDIKNMVVNRPFNLVNDNLLSTSERECYKNLIKDQTLHTRNLSTDSESINPLKLILQLKDDNTGLKRLFKISKTSDKLYIRMKGDIDKTYTLFIGDGFNKTISIVGTGNYKYYDLSDNISDVAFGSTGFVQDASGYSDGKTKLKFDTFIS